MAPASVNLLQQTPLDAALGDVLVSNPRVLRLVEFKRITNDDIKEEVKWTLLNAQLSKNEHLRSVSRKIHWYVQTQQDRRGFRSEAMPYLEISDLGSVDPYNIHALDRFVDAIADEAVSGEASEEEQALYRSYLALVCRSQGSPSTSSGGLLLQVTEDGKLQYVAISDLRQMMYSYEVVLQLKSRDREQRLMYEREREAAEREVRQRRQQREHGLEL